MFEDKAMTPLSQMQATKNILTEAQKIAYVGLCALFSQQGDVGQSQIGQAKGIKGIGIEYGALGNEDYGKALLSCGIGDERCVFGLCSKGKLS